MTDTLSISSPEIHHTLPPLGQINLTSWSLVKVSGEGCDDFLQGQLTINVNALEAGQLLPAAQCDHKGKTWTLWWVFRGPEAIYLLAKKAPATAALAQLQKFGVFSKVNFEELASASLTGLCGAQLSAWLDQHGWESQGSAVQWQQSSALLTFASPKGQRCLLVNADSAQLQAAELLPESCWDAQEILDGYAQLSEDSIGEHVPQALDLHLHGGISFNKGCYIGQETVARMRYLGKNKRGLYLLHGAQGQQAAVGAELQRQLGENWRRCGTVLRCVCDAEGILALAVLPNDLEADAVIALAEQLAAPLTLLPLERTAV